MTVMKVGCPDRGNRVGVRGDDITPGVDTIFPAPTPRRQEPDLIIVSVAKPGITENRSACCRLLWRWTGGANG